MRRPTLSVSGWFAAVCLLGTAVWACSSDDSDLFDEPSRGGTGGASGTDMTGGSSGSSTGGSTGGSPAGGSSGSSTGGDATGGTTTGGSTGDGGAAAEAGTDSGGTATGGSAGTAGNGGNGAGAGNGGTPTVGGAGMGGTLGGAGAGAGGAGAGGAGTGGAGKGGSGGGPGGCHDDGECKSTQYCKKASCDAATGECAPRGPECRGANAEFAPVCGCDGITYWNTCVIEHDGFNVAKQGECTGNDRPTCTRDGGGDSCPERSNAHCYRPVEACGDTSPMMGVCWVLPAECPSNEAQTQRYCGGTAGSARCIGLCEVIEAENSFQRDADRCAN